MNHLSRSLCRRRGFTLAELLVTVGIIAILIAILVPVLSMARGRAQEVRCLANQRSLMQAMLSYAADNTGYLPPSVSSYTPSPALPAGETLYVILFTERGNALTGQLVTINTASG